jgi:hypothetical protein
MVDNSTLLISLFNVGILTYDFSSRTSTSTFAQVVDMMIYLAAERTVWGVSGDILLKINYQNMSNPVIEERIPLSSILSSSLASVH